jgi:hypothetical protein
MEDDEAYVMLELGPLEAIHVCIALNYLLQPPSVRLDGRQRSQKARASALLLVEAAVRALNGPGVVAFRKDSGPLTAAQVRELWPEP